MTRQPVATDMTMDARTRRSRARLTEAILRLTAERSADSITVAELARESGVHRSTVYEHSESPPALLRLVLRAELDDVRLLHLTEVPQDRVAAAIRETTLEVLAHVERHAAVYSRALGSDDEAALHAMLSGHFRESVLLLLDAGVVTPPPGVESEMVARFIADGTVGAIDAWLRTPEPRAVDDFVAAYRQLMPDWWPL